MPLHINSITNDRSTSVLAWILQKGMDECNSIFVSDDNKYFHIRREIRDLRTGDAIGELVYTVKHSDERLEVLDLDITWNSDELVSVQFDKLCKGSSESNEYYLAEVMDGGHFELETVNRYVIKNDLENTENQVYISAFPFELSVFPDIDSFNEWAGFKNEITVGDTDIKVGGFSESFIMPGGIFKEDKSEEEHYSFLIGRVVDFRDVEIAFGEQIYSFVLAKVDTALGVIPIGIGREVFDLSEIQVDCIVAMNADVKADMARKEDFKYPDGSRA